MDKYCSSACHEDNFRGCLNRQSFDESDSESSDDGMVSLLLIYFNFVKRENEVTLSSIAHQCFLDSCLMHKMHIL